MRLDRLTRWLLGLSTAWVTLYPTLFVCFGLVLVESLPDLATGWRGRTPPGSIPAFQVPFLALVPVHCMSFMLYLGLVVAYGLLIWRQPNVPPLVRVLFFVGLIWLPMLAMPLWFYATQMRPTLPAWLHGPPDNLDTASKPSENLTDIKDL